MHEQAGWLTDSWETTSDALARDFSARLADSSALAVRVAYSVVRNRQDAEDVAQEAFVRAYRRFEQLRDREKFRAWLVRMTWRLAIDWKRSHRRRAAREDAVALMHPDRGDAEADAIESDRARRLWRAIDELPEKLRVVIVLAGIEGHGMKDVAALLDIPEGTVKSRLFDARRLLQERWR
jgi:RNA polymerase sigma-70 factor (ECF subfamily)